jgi:hypothetical protein
MDKKTFAQILDSLKLLIGLILLCWGAFDKQNQFLMTLGGTIIAIAGVEVRIGALGLNSPTKKGKK